jgi:hypothetical protein
MNNEFRDALTFYAVEGDLLLDITDRDFQDQDEILQAMRAELTDDEYDQALDNCEGTIVDFCDVNSDCKQLVEGTWNEFITSLKEPYILPTEWTDARNKWLADNA